jgi:cobalt-zinc-cadmium efflux system outer membrane protein
MASRLGLEQEIILGGKRRQQVRYAELEVEKGLMAQYAAAAELENRVRRLYAQLLLHQDQRALQEERLRLAEESLDAVQRKIASGEVSPIAESKASLEVTSARIGLSRIGRELESSRYALAATWGSESPSFEEAGDLPDDDGQVPGNGDLLAELEDSLGVKRLQAERNQAEVALLLAKAEAWPNPGIAGGVQRFEDSNDHAFFMEFSIPLPIFDRNQGGIDEAKARLKQVEQEYAQQLLSRKTELLDTAMQLRSVREELRSMEEDVLPSAELTFSSVSRGFEMGVQGYLDLLDARRLLLEARGERMSLVRECRELRAELDLLLVPAPVGGDATGSRAANSTF